MQRKNLLLITAALVLAGCASIPTGPNVMVLPGSGKDFEQFRYDDAVCRDFAAHQTGISAGRAKNDATITGAAVGTVLGAAGGAAIGAATGDPAMGAAVGSGVGLLGGAAVGADQGESARWSVQRRYDNAYVQCMYSKGHQVPVSGGGYQRRGPTSGRSGRDIPPPPAGYPPPPPPPDYYDR